MTTSLFSEQALRFFNSSVRILWRLLSLERRKRLAVWIDKHGKVQVTHNLSMALIRNWAKKDVDAYHRFLWSNHLGYASIYEKTRSRNGELCIENFSLTKRMLFEDLSYFLLHEGRFIGQNNDINKVLEVGCSSGYLLRYVETDLFPNAEILEGIDIDKMLSEKETRTLPLTHRRSVYHTPTWRSQPGL